MKVGWIFTDLEPDGRNGKVAYKRSIVSWCLRLVFLSPVSQHTHLVTAEECILAADLQSKYPNPCKHSASGYFGSKFTTLCISGNEKQEVESRGYQVGVAWWVEIIMACSGFKPVYVSGEGWLSSANSGC